MGFRIRKQKKGPDRATDAVRQALGDRSVVLIGLMGAGKTSIGHRVAKRLDLPFTDADAEIEAAAGMSVSDFSIPEYDTLCEFLRQSSKPSA